MRREKKIKGGLVQLESLDEWSTIIEVVFMPIQWMYNHIIWHMQVFG